MKQEFCMGRLRKKCQTKCLTNLLFKHDGDRSMRRQGILLHAEEFVTEGTPRTVSLWKNQEMHFQNMCLKT